MNIPDDIEINVKQYYKALLEMFKESRRPRPEDYLNRDVVKQVLGENPKTFLIGVLYMPNKFYKRAENILEKWEENLDGFYYEMEDAWERIKQGTKEDWWMRLEDEHTDDDGEVDYDAIETETGWSDPDDISDEDLFYGNEFDRSHFETYAAEEISHNIKGRYKIWDKYIEPFFSYSDLSRNNYSGGEDTWLPVDNAATNLQQALEELKPWLLNRIKLIIKDVTINKRRYIDHIFTNYNGYFEWESLEGVLSKYEI